MYYRRKILLSILNSFGGKLEKIRLQKLLFLFCQEQRNPVYYFVPYKFGCYSFQANADLNTMKKYEQVDESNKTWLLKSTHNYIREIKDDDRIILSQLKSKFWEMSTDDIIKYTYREFPFFAINSIVASDKLSKEEYNKVLNEKQISEQEALFTIGYEGISLEEYLQKLITNDIKVLCDVRNFPRSMKYGFSKNQLKNACEGLGIIYFHLPNLGIISEKRKELNTQKDYNVLFDDYRKTVLKNNMKDQIFILELIKQYKRVAITCFEKNIKQCHRSHLACSLTKLDGWNYEVNHI